MNRTRTVFIVADRTEQIPSGVPIKRVLRHPCQMQVVTHALLERSRKMLRASFSVLGILTADRHRKVLLFAEIPIERHETF